MNRTKGKKMEVTQKGETITIKTNGLVYKVKMSNRFKRFQIRKDGKLLQEAYSFQDVLNKVDQMVAN